MKCPQLPTIQFGAYNPENCGTDKSVYGANCSITCNPGFKLSGPSYKTCSGKFGHWSDKNQSICEDVAAPVITCPGNITAEALPGKNYAFVSWAVPNVTDNSDFNITVWTKPAISDNSNFKFKIGKTVVTYIAIDAYKNKAKCNFSVEVLGKYSGAQFIVLDIICSSSRHAIVSSTRY